MQAERQSETSPTNILMLRFRKNVKVRVKLFCVVVNINSGCTSFCTVKLDDVFERRREDVASVREPPARGQGRPLRTKATAVGEK